MRNSNKHRLFLHKCPEAEDNGTAQLSPLVPYKQKTTGLARESSPRAAKDFKVGIYNFSKAAFILECTLGTALLPTFKGLWGSDSTAKLTQW